MNERTEKSERSHERWTNERMNERTTERKNDWTNERMNEGTTDWMKKKSTS